MNMRDKMRDLAYSKEDAYFLKKDQDLIDKMRKEAAGRKRELAEKHKGAPYWMKCPKCDSDLDEGPCAPAHFGLRLVLAGVFKIPSATRMSLYGPF